MTVHPGRLNAPDLMRTTGFSAGGPFFTGSFPLPHPSVLQTDADVFPLYIRPLE